MKKLNYLPRKTLRHYLGSPFGSSNTAHTAHCVRSSYGFAETSYMLGTLGEMAAPVSRS